MQTSTSTLKMINTLINHFTTGKIWIFVISCHNCLDMRWHAVCEKSTSNGQQCGFTPHDRLISLVEPDKAFKFLGTAHSKRVSVWHVFSLEEIVWLQWGLVPGQNVQEASLDTKRALQKSQCLVWSSLNSLRLSHLDMMKCKRSCPTGRFCYIHKLVEKWKGVVVNIQGASCVFMTKLWSKKKGAFQKSQELKGAIKYIKSKIMSRFFN